MVRQEPRQLSDLLGRGRGDDVDGNEADAGESAQRRDGLALDEKPLVEKCNVDGRPLLPKYIMSEGLGKGFSGGAITLLSLMIRR
jgi:hypothetical protein